MPNTKFPPGKYKTPPGGEFPPVENPCIAQLKNTVQFTPSPTGICLDKKTTPKDDAELLEKSNFDLRKARSDLRKDLESLVVGSHLWEGLFFIWHMDKRNTNLTFD